MSVAEKTAIPNLSSILGKLHLIIPMGVMGILLVMVLPMPTMIMDLLISLNITLSIIIMLVSMYILQPVHFSVFPSLLLIITLFRLALNVASTRLILLHGAEGRGCGGESDPVLRPVCRRRQLLCRHRRFSRPHSHSIHRHQPRRRPHFGSHRPVHSGCHARQTDEHRRGSERRHHQ